MKICAVLAVMVLFVGLWGCSEKKEAVPASAAPSFKTADELIAEAEARSQAQVSSSQEMVFGELQGTYIFQDPQLEEQYRPTLALQLDGTAFFRPNLLAAMGELYATYEIEGKTIRLTVTELNFEGFTGDNVTELVFDVLEDGSLELAYTVPDTEIGVTRAGDRFIPQKKK